MNTLKCYGKRKVNGEIANIAITYFNGHKKA